MAKRARTLAEHAEFEGRKQQVREEINQQMERMEGRGFWIRLAGAVLLAILVAVALAGVVIVARS
jgi:hypothetical protein